MKIIKIAVLIGLLNTNISHGNNGIDTRIVHYEQNKAHESLNQLFKIEMETDRIVIKSLIPFNEIESEIYLNVINSKAEILIHQKIEQGELYLSLDNFEIGIYNIEVSRNSEKIVKRIALK